MARTLGNIVNSGLKQIGEPEIAAFTTGNILQADLIEAANERVRFILDASPSAYRWTYARTTLTTTAKITDGTVTVTNGSTTVTSTDSAGASANNFTNAAAGMFFRLTGTDGDTSYEISSVDTASSPDTLVLSTAFVGTSATIASYTILKDIYAITDTDFDELRIAAYGQARGLASGVTGSLQTDQLGLVDLDTIYQQSLGDPHRDTGGKPTLMAPVGVDSSDQPRYLLWPYPGSDQLVITLWYTRNFTQNSTFATNMFGGDAPSIAYDCVTHYVQSRAHLWDKNLAEADRFMLLSNADLESIKSREARSRKDSNTMNVETYRRSFVGGIRVESQIAFDQAPWAYG